MLASRRLCHAGITVARSPSLNGAMSSRPAAVAAITAGCLLVGALAGCAAAQFHREERRHRQVPGGW